MAGESFVPHGQEAVVLFFCRRLPFTDKIKPESYGELIMLTDEKVKAGFEAAGDRMDDIEGDVDGLGAAVKEIGEMVRRYSKMMTETRAYARPDDPRTVFATKEEAKEFGEIVVSVLRSMPLDKEKSQDSQTIAAGSVLVGEELSSRLIELMGVYGKFRKNCQIVQMNSQRLDVPKISGDVTIYVPGQKVSILSLIHI